MVIHRDHLILGDYTHPGLIGFDLRSGHTDWIAEMNGIGSLTVDVNRERIYTFTIDGSRREIFAIDANDGNVIWYNGDQNGQRDGYSPQLLANGDLLAWASLSGTVRHLDVDTGELGEEVSIVSLACYSDYNAWYVSQGYLVSVDPITGNRLWISEDASLENCCLWDVQTNDDVVIAKFRSDLFAYSRSTQMMLWHTNEANIVQFPVLRGNTVYMFDLGARLQIVDAVSGVNRGEIQFEPAAPGHDDDLLAGDSISSSLIAATENIVAIYFGDTDMLSVYEVVPTI